MTQPSANDIRVVYRRAIKSQPDSKTTNLKIDQLVQALGVKAATELVGRPLDIDGASKCCEKRRAEILTVLYREREELEAIARVEGKDSRRELQALQERISKCESGKLDVFMTVPVNVGKLRAALDKADGAKSPPSTV